jgi:hypothetical protein
MTKTFTQNDVLRYVYDEVSHEEKKEIECALLFDESLSEFYSDIADLKRAINKTTKHPSNRVIQNILNYSQSFPQTVA